MKNSTYAQKLRDPRWQKKRLEVMSRDGFKCRDCGDSTATLNVHHCAYDRRGPWMVNDNLLLTLCEDCHEQRQESEDDARLALGYIFAKTPDAGGLSHSLIKIAQDEGPVLFLFSDNTVMPVGETSASP